MTCIAETGAIGTYLEESLKWKGSRPLLPADRARLQMLSSAGWFFLDRLFGGSRFQDWLTPPALSKTYLKIVTPYLRDLEHHLSQSFYPPLLLPPFPASPISLISPTPSSPTYQGSGYPLDPTTGSSGDVTSSDHRPVTPSHDEPIEGPKYTSLTYAATTVAYSIDMIRTIFPSLISYIEKLYPECHKVYIGVYERPRIKAWVRREIRRDLKRKKEDDVTAGAGGGGGGGEGEDRRGLTITPSGSNGDMVRKAIQESNSGDHAELEEVKRALEKELEDAATART